MSGRRKRHPHVDPQPSDGFAEMQNPGLVHDLADTEVAPSHPFEGDQHGRDRHDTIPAEEEWAEEEFEPREEHDPSA